MEALREKKARLAVMRSRSLHKGYVILKGERTRIYRIMKDGKLVQTATSKKDAVAWIAAQDRND
jgi:hypothetical protein